MAFLKSIFDGNEREVARLRRTAEKVNALESTMANLGDAELTEKTAEFRARLEKGEKPGQIAKTPTGGKT